MSTRDADPGGRDGGLHSRPNISPEGDERENRYRIQFEKMLRQQAIVFAHRRGAPKSLDESDFDSAFRHLLASQRNDWLDYLRKVIAQVCVFVAGAFVPAGIALWQAGNIAAGAGLTFGMVVLAFLAAILHEMRVFRRT